MWSQGSKRQYSKPMIRFSSHRVTSRRKAPWFLSSTIGSQEHRREPILILVLATVGLLPPSTPRMTSPRLSHCSLLTLYSSHLWPPLPQSTHSHHSCAISCKVASQHFPSLPHCARSFSSFHVPEELLVIGHLGVYAVLHFEHTWQHRWWQMRDTVEPWYNELVKSSR